MEWLELSKIYIFVNSTENIVHLCYYIANLFFNGWGMYSTTESANA